MNYVDVISGDFPNAKEAKRLYVKAIRGNDADKWRFVLSQAPWIKSVIIRYFDAKLYNDDMISDGLLSVFRTVSQKNLKTTVPIWGFRKIAKLRLYGDIKYGDLSRRSQIYVRRNAIGKLEKMIMCSFDDDLDENKQAAIRRHMIDHDATDPAVQAEDASIADECRLVVEQASGTDQSMIGIRIRQCRGKVTEDGIIDFKKLGISRQAVSMFRRKLRTRLYDKCPALREMFKNPKAAKGPAGESHDEDRAEAEHQQDGSGNGQAR